MREQSIQEFAEAHLEIQTPYYIADESLLIKNLEKIKYVREKSGAKLLLALKCFSTWSVFPLMSQYMDGTTSSSLFEARLGHEKFAGETHAYGVAYSENDVKEARTFASKIIFRVRCLMEMKLNAQARPKAVVNYPDFLSIRWCEHSFPTMEF